MRADGPDPVIYRRGDTYVVAPNRAEAQSYAASVGGLPEAPLIDWALAELMPERGQFIDIGAHCGTWSTAFARAGHAVVAFEPNPHLYRCLKAGMALNAEGWSYQLYASAVGAKPGKARLTWPVDNWWWGGGGSVVVQHDKELAGELTVLVCTLDGLDTGWKPSLVKIDVEGAELDVLHGGVELFRSTRPKIIFECWDEERGQRRKELFAFLDYLEYAVEPVSWPETYIATPR